jgi:thioester reductase-like protein
MRLGNVKEVLLLSRPKKKKTNDDRLNELFSGFLFQEMQKFDANFRSKVRIVNGDMEPKDLGMSSVDIEYIKSNVQIFIHGAAALSMDGKLNESVAINVRGTNKLLELALETKYLESFVYISTAYSQCCRLDLKEEYYASPMDFKQAIKLLEDFRDEDSLSVLTKKIIAPWPNVYTFTKAITEDMIRQYQEQLPIAIARPSIGN